MIAPFKRWCNISQMKPWLTYFEKSRNQKQEMKDFQSDGKCYHYSNGGANVITENGTFESCTEKLRTENEKLKCIQVIIINI